MSIEKLCRAVEKGAERARSCPAGDEKGESKLAWR